MSSSNAAEVIFAGNDEAVIFRKFCKDFLAGGIAAAVGKTAMAPVERVKLLLQVQDSQRTISVDKRYKGIVDCFVRVPHEQGFLSFWRGNWANVLRTGSQESIGFALKDFYKVWLLDSADANRNYWRFAAGNIAAGSASGVTTYLMIYPLDFARTRLAMDVGRGMTREFNGLADCMLRIYRLDGIRGLYRGLSSSLQFIVIYRGAYFGLFDSSVCLVVDDPKKLTFLMAFAVGQIVTLIAGFVSYPLDTVRRRMTMQSGRQQNDVLYRNTIDCWRKIYRLEGSTAFFKGAFINSIRGIGSAIVLAVYSEISKHF